ncbi:hypothetical protein BDR05DRAFT_876600, partial [Suillus weaverae]
QSAVPAVLEYKTFEMKQAVCSVSESGELKMDYSEEPEDIMVVKGWQSHIKAGKPHQGYLGQGLTKFVFQGRHNNTSCAILQCKHIHLSETDNTTDLQAKLETLHLAQYFLDSFYRRAETNGVHTLPKMRWNISGAFIGKLIGKLADAPKNGEEDSHSLVFSVFMMLPLLPTGALCQEIKFSGSKEVGVNHNSLGSAVDAYAHHIIVDLMYEIVISDIQGIITPDQAIVFFDPQSHTSDLGYWDRGQPAIDTFMESHKCNKFCKALGLEAHTTDSQSSNNRKGPLHIGFDS